MGKAKKPKAIVPCVTCGSWLFVYPSQIVKKRTCSDQCHRAYVSARQAGERSHRWRGGRTSEDRALRNSAQADQWRRDVLARDDYTCQLCRERGGRLTADHIVPWSVSPAMRFLLENGRCLCWPCHAKLPTTGEKFSQLMAEIKALSGGKASLHFFATYAGLASPDRLWASGAKAARLSLIYPQELQP